MSRNSKVKGSRLRSDEERLELFLKLAAELGTSDLAKKGLSYKQSYQWNKLEGFKHELQQPDETDLRAFLTTFRKFISEDSDVYLQAIHRIIYKRLTREEYRESLRTMNAQWRKLFQKGWMRLKINGRDVSPEYALKVYINGRYFHDDLDYAQELEDLERNDPMVSETHRAQFLAAVVDTSNYIGWLAHNIDYLLREGLLDF
jgi:hypothetical protein